MFVHDNPQDIVMQYLSFTCLGYRHRYDNFYLCWAAQDGQGKNNNDCRWHYHLKNIANVKTALDVQLNILIMQWEVISILKQLQAINGIFHPVYSLVVTRNCFQILISKI